MSRRSSAKGADSFKDAWQDVKRELKTQAAILFGFVGVLWLVELVDLFLLSGYLDRFGVAPRSVVGLRGILLMPFLHGGLPHLIANSGPLLLLGWFVMWRETHHWFAVTAIAAVVAGLGAWLIAPAHSIHIGASGVAFGYLGYLMLRGYFDRKLWSMVGSVIIGVMYGGLLFGVLPGQVGISWQGHLFGFIGGALAARLLSGRVRTASPAS